MRVEKTENEIYKGTPFLSQKCFTNTIEFVPQTTDDNETSVVTGNNEIFFPNSGIKYNSFSDLNDLNYNKLKTEPNCIPNLNTIVTPVVCRKGITLQNLVNHSLLEPNIRKCGTELTSPSINGVEKGKGLMALNEDASLSVSKISDLGSNVNNGGLNPLVSPFSCRQDNGVISNDLINGKLITTSPLIHTLSTTSVIENSVYSAFNSEMRDEQANDTELNLQHSFDILPVVNESKGNSDDAINTLNNIRMKYVKNVIIGHLNINSIANKFESLNYIVNDNIDILVIGETKLDETFTEKLFIINGFKKPYRLDRNHDGGGVMIYVRGDIPSKEVVKHKFTKNIEAIFIEINLRKNKFLLVGTYHSTNREYGASDIDYFEQIGLALDVYSNYEKFLIAGDFNVEENEHCIKNFMDEFNVKNLVKENTCFKNPENPRCIDLFLTNSVRSFIHTSTISTGLSDFHKMIVTVLKTTFPKAKPKIVHYRDFSRYRIEGFSRDLENNLKSKWQNNYESFETIFLNIFNNHAPIKKKVIRANQKPYVTKDMRKAIMIRSQLENKFYEYRTEEYRRGLKKQKNYCNRLYKRERKNYYSQLNLSNINDNKKFWNTMKPLFSDKGGVKDNIILVEDNKIISKDSEVAQAFQHFFANAVNSLDITENRAILTDVKDIKGEVEKTIKMFEIHPSIINIKEKVKNDFRFSFTEINTDTIKAEIIKLKGNKMGTFMNINAKQLKQVCEVVCEPLMVIWNTEVIENKKFPLKLKLADISPIFKKLQSTLVNNYRPISVLPVVSKVFERIIQKQINEFMEKHLSPYLCGYRKGYNCQYALLVMIEKWKLSLDNSEFAGGILMDLSKAFDTINHKLLIAKLHAYGFNINALEIILDYLSDRWQRIKINTEFSSWSAILSGVPQGSVLGPNFFNIYINDLFYLFTNTNVCNIADDTTLYACDVDLHTLLSNLENDTMSAIIWFELNYMKLNQDKCHFLISGNTPEHLWAKVGEHVIWESKQEKLLGLTIDKNLNFNAHLAILCKKASVKVTVLSRLTKLVPFEKKRLLLKSFIESQFSYCPLIWMFCSREMNRKINYIHERALRLVYDDYTNSFNDLLIRDKSVCIHHRNIQKVAIEMFRVKENICPKEFQKIFCKNTNARSKTYFQRPNVNKVFKGEYSLRYFGPIVWDSMVPEYFKEILTLEEFKSKISTWIPTNCRCRLCKEYVPNLGFVTIFE